MKGEVKFIDSYPELKMQINRNNDMGLIVTNEEKRWKKENNNFNSSGNCDRPRVCESD